MMEFGPQIWEMQVSGWAKVDERMVGIMSAKKGKSLYNTAKTELI